MQGNKLIIELAEPLVDEDVLEFMWPKHYVARDSNGEVFVFYDKPRMGVGKWMPGDDEGYLRVNVDPFPSDRHWKECIWQKL